MQLGYGSCTWGNFPEMDEMGVNVTLGCDGASCSNHFDMFRQMSLVAGVNTEVRCDVYTCYPQTVLDWATINGAKAMLMENSLGSLEPGKIADLITIDLMRPEWVPWHNYNLIENMIKSATGNSVTTSIINGKIVMEDGKVKTINEMDVLERGQVLVEPFIKSSPFLGRGKVYPEGLPPLW